MQTIKLKLEDSNPKRERKNQSVVFYFLTVSIPIVLTWINSYVIINLGTHPELKQALIAIVAAGFIICVVSNLQIATWQEVVKLYFILDSLIPVLIAATIGLFTVINYRSTNKWY